MLNQICLKFLKKDILPLVLIFKILLFLTGLNVQVKSQNKIKNYKLINSQIKIRPY
jgi:hypothetical protein